MLNVIMNYFSLVRFADELAGFGYGLRATAAQVDNGSRCWLPGLSIALTMNIMLLTLPLYFGLEPGQQTFALMMGVAALLTGIQLAVCGRGLVLQAWRAMRMGLAHLDQPLTLGISTGFAASLIELGMGRPEGLYFDSVSMLLTFILLGGALQADRLDAVRWAVDEPAAPVQWSVRRTSHGAAEAVGLDQLCPGDLYLLPSAGLVPVRSALRGELPAHFDPSWITGESEAVTEEPGASVPSGYRLVDHQGLRLKALESWEAANLNELLNIPNVGVGEGEQPLWLQRFVGYFVPAVVVLAALAGGFWTWAEGAAVGLEVLVAVLVVSCPCTLALGLPLARRLATAAMARQGLLVRSELFCGDGVNDLPVMEKAELSCSLAGDQPVVPSRCDLLVSRDGVLGLVQAVAWGMDTDRVGRCLLLAGLAYNVAVLALAVVGWMRPWLAAAVMPLSSVVVVMALLAWHRRRSAKAVQ